MVFAPGYLPSVVPISSYRLLSGPKVVLYLQLFFFMLGKTRELPLALPPGTLLAELVPLALPQSRVLHQPVSNLTFFYLLPFPSLERSYRADHHDFGHAPDGLFPPHAL